MPEQAQKKKENIVDKVVNFIFSHDERKWLILILLIGALLRLIVATHVGMVADEAVHGTNAINIIHSGVINEMNECPAWFYLTDIAYKIFGVDAMGARFLSFFFGSLAILVVYLIAEMIYNRKIALVSSFIFAFAAFSIRNTITEMDATMGFFVFLSFFLFLKKLKLKNELSYLSIAFLGVAILVKSISIIFIPPMVAYFFYYASRNKEKRIINRNKSRIIFSVILLLFLVTPILAYNYILYHQKGITDILFSRFFKINRDIYAGFQGTYDTINLNETLVFIPVLINVIFSLEPVILALAILGTLLIFTKKEYFSGRFLAVFSLFGLVALTFLARQAFHFIPFDVFFAISAAVSIDFISKKLGSKIKRKVTISIILIAILITSLVVLMPSLTSTSAIFKLRQFAVSSVSSNDIVVADARIYRGRIAWMFNDKAYIESSLFPQIMDVNQNLSGTDVPVTVYFVECAIDDCGWGTIASQPDFNASVEQMFNVIKNNSAKEKVILGGGGYNGADPTGMPVYNIYKAQIEVKPQLFSVIYSTHDWFMYPVRWEQPDWYDKYSPRGFFQTSFNLIGRLFLWIAVLLAILSPVLLIRELVR